jgi:hypothetical protein
MDITSKISELLNDPNGMDKIKAAADMLLQNSSDSMDLNANNNENNYDNDRFSIPDGLLDNIGNIGGIMKIMSFLQNNEADKRTTLLLALKPHLSSERAKRVDKAVSILKIANILPVLKQEGLLDLL